MGKRRGKTSGEDRSEGAMDKAKGRLKEAAGAVTGDEAKKSEGRADQRSGTFKEKKGKIKDVFK
ncbi:MAG: CsbD family protein [Actinomycetota bacterium]|nr:CsbD family protein [Actinomycetota bacterium]